MPAGLDPRLRRERGLRPLPDRKTARNRPVSRRSGKKICRPIKVLSENRCWITGEFSPPPSGAAILWRMKGKTPLWLICDVSACLRLHGALVILALAMRWFIPRNKSRGISREGVIWITVWLAACEILLRWVIARQAFRLCGLDPRNARTFRIAEARSSTAWAIRGRDLARMYEAMTVYARRWARRIRQAMAAKPAAPVRAQSALLLSLLSSPFFILSSPFLFSRQRRLPFRPASTSARRPGYLPARKHFARALPIHRRGRGRLCV